MTCSGSHDLLYMPLYGVSGRLVIWRDGQTSSRRATIRKYEFFVSGRRQSQQVTCDRVILGGLYDHRAPQSHRVTLDCPNEYDAHEHDQGLNGGAEGFLCTESIAKELTSACMIIKKSHRPAGASNHRHRFRTTRIPLNARTRAPPPDIPRETLGSVFCYIPSMLGPSQGVLPFKSHHIGLHRARHWFVARTASRQEDGLCGPARRALQATDLIPRQMTEDGSLANYTAQLAYPRRIAGRIADECSKLQRVGLAQGPDQRGWTSTDSGTRQTTAEVTPALTAARGTAMAQPHASAEKGFLELCIPVFVFRIKFQGSPRVFKENEVFFLRVSQPTTLTGTRSTCTRSNEPQRPQTDINEPTRAPPRERARAATKSACGLQTLTGNYRTRIAHRISGRRSFGKGKRTATLWARKSLEQTLASPPTSKPHDAEPSREARIHRSEWHHGRRVGTSGLFGSHESACRSAKKAARTGFKPKASRPLVQLPPHASSVQRYSDECAVISSGSQAERSTADVLGRILKREQTAPASQKTTHGSRHAGKP